MIHALLVGLLLRAHSLLAFPGLHSPFHWAEMILQRQHKRELCGPSKCAVSAGGVRRSGRWKVGWEGEKLMEGDIVWGEGEAKFDDKASVVLEQPWHYDTVDSQKYTVAQPNRHGDPSPPAHQELRPAFYTRFKPCYSNAGQVCEFKVAVSSYSNTKNWAKIATSETLCVCCPAHDEQFDGKELIALCGLIFRHGAFYFFYYFFLNF